MKRSALLSMLLWALPLALLALLVCLELLTRDHAAHFALNRTLPETVKEVVQLSHELSQLLVGLATAIVGGVAYYFRDPSPARAPLSGRPFALALATIAAAVLSVFWGQLWLSELRNQLSSDYFDPGAPGVVWAERLQYIFFVLSLGWFGLFTMDREQARPRELGASHSEP